MRDFSSGSETILELRDIHTFYGQSHILQGVSFVVHAGETVALLGRNGAGKTTTVRTIMGFTPPRQGVILLRGQPITGWPPYAVAQAGVGLVAQGKRVFPSLSVLENLRLAATRGEWTIERVSLSSRGWQSGKNKLQDPLAVVSNKCYQWHAPW